MCILYKRSDFSDWILNICHADVVAMLKINRKENIQESRESFFWTAFILYSNVSTLNCFFIYLFLPCSI